MKKSFKRSIAILLAVLMIVCTFPMAAFADEEKVPNINIQIGALYNTKTTTNGHRQYTGSRLAKENFAQSGLNTPLDYKDGVITDGGYTYTTGDFITVSVILENVSQLAAAQVAVKYSDNLTPAGCFASGCNTTGTGAIYAIGEPMADQSGDALYNKTQPSLLGELSYLDSENKVMHAEFAAQDGGDYTTSANGQFVLATYMFKITGTGLVTFSLVDDAAADDAYYLGTTANGGKVEEYVTFVETENDGSKGLAFMNKDADGESVNVPTVVEYTITFIDKDGIQTSTKYAEGATITVPELPETAKTADNHTTYAWNVEPATTAAADATYQVVGTTNAHVWDEGVVTTPATETTKGIKTYTCTVCSQTKTEDIDKLPPAHVHSYGAWVYNKDAVWDSKAANRKDGTATRTCDCGESETKTITGTGALRASSATVNLGAAVTLKTVFAKSRFASSFESVYLNINYGGVDYRLDDIYDYNASNYGFDFDKIAPQDFGAPVQITMHAITPDGIDCEGFTIEYSIKQYATNQLKGSDVKLNTLLVEMLYYGEMAQKYYGVDVDNLVTADLTAEQKALHSDYIPTYNSVANSKYEVNSGTNVMSWAGATMALEGKLLPKFKFTVAKGTDLSDYVVHCTVAGVEQTFNIVDNPDNFENVGSTNVAKDGYNFVVTTLSADQFREPIDVKITTKDGTVVSNTIRYSVESYALSSQCAANATLKTLVDQILRYGRADAVYTGKAATYE